jgi:hypothetical protein
MLCSASAGGVARPKANLRLPIGWLGRSDGRVISVRLTCWRQTSEAGTQNAPFRSLMGNRKGAFAITTSAFNPRRGLRDQPSCCRPRPRNERGPGRLL